MALVVERGGIVDRLLDDRCRDAVVKVGRTRYHLRPPP